MANLSKAEREYCEQILEETKEFIPAQYVTAILDRAQIKGLDFTPDQIRKFKNKRFHDLDLAHLFREEAQVRKEGIHLA